MTKAARETRPQRQGFFQYFRFGESYTSLVLGIVVVIITAILLVSFVRNRNLSNINNTKPEIASNQTQVAQQASPSASVSPTGVITVTPTVKASPTVTRAPTATATPTKSKPTTRPSVTSRPTTRPIVKATVTPTQQPSRGTVGRTYTVVAGDNLWKIAEKIYRSGYNWVDIANANKLSNPGYLAVGTKLIIPNVQRRVVRTETASSIASYTTGTKITGKTYKVVKGDYLWDIAVRAYGNGFRWVEIARANNIVNPDIIYPGTELRLNRNNSPNARPSK